MWKRKHLEAHVDRSSSHLPWLEQVQHTLQQVRYAESLYRLTGNLVEEFVNDKKFFLSDYCSNTFKSFAKKFIFVHFNLPLCWKHFSGDVPAPASRFHQQFDAQLFLPANNLLITLILVSSDNCIWPRDKKKWSSSWLCTCSRSPELMSHFGDSGTSHLMTDIVDRPPDDRYC